MYPSLDELFEIADDALSLEGSVGSRSNAAVFCDIATSGMELSFFRELRAHDGSGEEHVCPGPGKCEFILLNEDRFLVCSKSGICYEAEQVEEAFDNQLVRRSGNPDDHGGEVSFASFRGRRDSASASELARLQASKIDDSKSVEWAPLETERRREVVKRGARCVGQLAAPEKKRRTRTPKREVTDYDGKQALVQDASNVIARLLHADGAREAVVEDGADSKLANVNVDELVKQLRSRYVRQCLATNQRVNLHVIADIEIGAFEAVREARARLRYARAHSASNVPVELREAMARLAVSLWTASCSTKYIKEISRTDGFRAFVSGVLFGTRRGFTLCQGVELIPTLPALAEVLPTLRMASQTSVKSLQASSHRGLCTLVKSVNSIESLEERKRIYDVSVSIAKTIKSKFG